MSSTPIYIGSCQISQENNINVIGERLYLTGDNDRAVAIPHNVGGRFVWKIIQDGVAPRIMLSLMPGGSIYPPPEELALTLGPGIGGMNEMKILVEPARPKDQAQVWELKNMQVIKKSEPKILKAEIHPIEGVQYSAATETIEGKGEGPEKYVNAVPLDWTSWDRTWQFEYIAENE